MIRREFFEELNLDPCMTEFLYMMRTYSRVVHDSVKDSSEVNMQRMGMLVILRADCDGASQSEIAETLHVKPSSVTSMLNNMEKEGLIVRISDNEDKRIKRIYLTEEGKKNSDDIFKYIIGLANDFFSNFTDEEKTQFIYLIGKMENNIMSFVDKNN